MLELSWSTAFSLFLVLFGVPIGILINNHLIRVSKELEKDSKDNAQHDHTSEMTNKVSNEIEALALSIRKKESESKINDIHAAIFGIRHSRPIRPRKSRRAHT